MVFKVTEFAYFHIFQRTLMEYFQNFGFFLRRGIETLSEYFALFPSFLFFDLPINHFLNAKIHKTVRKGVSLLFRLSSMLMMSVSLSASWDARGRVSAK